MAKCSDITKKQMRSARERRRAAPTGWANVQGGKQSNPQVGHPALYIHHKNIITMKQPLFTESQFAGTRCYHFDAREDVQGDPYLQIVECPTKGGRGKRERIFVHAEDLEEFRRHVNSMVDRCLAQWPNVSKS